MIRLVAAVLFGLTLTSLAVAQTPNHSPPAGMTCPGDKIVWVNTRSGI
jgi:hypothetical protein